MGKIQVKCLGARGSAQQGGKRAKEEARARLDGAAAVGAGAGEGIAGRCERKGCGKAAGPGRQSGPAAAADSDVGLCLAVVRSKRHRTTGRPSR